MSKQSQAYQAAYGSLNDEQRRAVDKIDGPVLVIAGPGTGKTQLLTTRIGRILELSDSAAENILCLTFSESAARTMQERLAAMIGPAAYDVTISTYHGFGSELIRRYPDLFSLSEDARPADDLMLDRTVREVLNSLDYSNPLKSDFYVHDLKELISGYKRALITPELLESICKQNLVFIIAASKLVNQYLKAGERITKGQLAAYESLLQDSTSLPGDAPESITPLRTLWLEDLGKSLDVVHASGKMTALSKWKTAWLENDGDGSFVVKSPRVNNRQISAADIFNSYNKLLEQYNLFDYDDMIMMAIKGLERNKDIKLTLQERYQFILLDEFQDTNEAQLRLVELLADNPINEGRPNVLAVGDDDQAIYSFQGAHYSHMRRFFDSYRDVELVSLKTNYRSTPGIVAFSSAVRSQISEGLDLAPKLLESHTDTSKEQLMRIELNLDSEHLAWTAKHIHKLIDEGHKAEDIAVLAPKHRLLRELIPYLHVENIPVSYDQKDNILENDQIVELITQARLVLALSLQDNMLADSLWPVVLSYRHWQLPTSLLWKLSWQARDERRSWTELVLESTELRNIGLFFIKLSQITEYTSFELILNYLVGSLPLEINDPKLKQYSSPFFVKNFESLNKQSEFVSANEWRLLGHLSILRTRAKASSEEGLNLQGLVRFVDAYDQADLRIIDTSPFQESDDAVKLMTAFASKGQEYKTVIIIDLVDEIWGGKSRSQSSKIALPQNLKQVKLDINVDDEKLRLLFVAISRARERLVLVGYKSDLVGKEASHLRYLNEHEEDGKLISPLLPEQTKEIISHHTPEVSVEDLRPVWFSDHLDRSSPDRRALLEDRLKLFKLSATKLNAFSDIPRGGPTQFYLDSILQFPSAPSLSSQFGSAIHGTLDWQFKQTAKLGTTPKLEDILAEFETRLRKRRLETHDLEQLLKRGKECLGEYLTQTEIINGKNDLSEESFETNLNGARLVGEIDRLIVNDNDKSLHIIDFKTGQSYDRWTGDIKPFHHARQLYFYKLLIETDQRFKNYHVDGATIQFVEPDKDDGKIKSITLHFNEAESIKLNEYIALVWEKIMTLDFPDCSAYPDTLKGIKQFEASLVKN